MFVKKEISFDDLKEICWSGALQNLEEIEEKGKENELMQLLGEVFFDEIPTETELNDFLWFENFENL